MSDKTKAAQMKKDMEDGVIICRSSWLALIEYTLKLEAMLQPADCGQAETIPHPLTDAATLRVTLESGMFKDSVMLSWSAMRQSKVKVIHHHVDRMVEDIERHLAGDTPAEGV